MIRISEFESRPISLRRLTDICAAPHTVTRDEALIIRDNPIARREIIRLGLSPSKIIASFNLEEEHEEKQKEENIDDILFE